MAWNDYKGDSTIYKVQVLKKKVIQDISTWKIIAEFGDGTNTIKKATANIAGGSDTQIKITDGPNGQYEIYLDKGETTNFAKNSYIETATLFDSTGKDTLYHEDIIFLTPAIDWEIP